MRCSTCTRSLFSVHNFKSFIFESKQFVDWLGLSVQVDSLVCMLLTLACKDAFINLF